MTPTAIGALKPIFPTIAFVGVVHQQTVRPSWLVVPESIVLGGVVTYGWEKIKNESCRIYFGIPLAKYILAKQRITYKGDLWGEMPK